IYLPPDDRRNYCAGSERTKEEFPDAYWTKLWAFYEKDGGFQHVGAYLRDYDLNGFDAKAPPLRTATWWAIVDSHRAPEDAELAARPVRTGNPDVVTLEDLNFEAAKSKLSGDGFFAWINDRKNRRVVPHRLDKCGYMPVRNDAAGDGLWKIKGKRQVVYARKD